MYVPHRLCSTWVAYILPIEIFVLSAKQGYGRTKRCLLNVNLREMGVCIMVIGAAKREDNGGRWWRRGPSVGKEFGFYVMS